MPCGLDWISRPSESYEISALTQCDLGNTENSAFLSKNENNS
ncbi:hypothetical protein BAZSYMA_ACONTIG143448_1 [Bathymodiolus azoricus thioautotrophic gill symbiont]|uniref:Uncharacterized protein n=1 Tax=Bathymodiolus azoricus thioautotrophic gill symbiont TaxID=235205 RepID=A0A1H6N0G5_9GAMM|nr:hypothetical protein BAZSYMA_ACONTIG143448_1 [Bathymodiolus azoricus thioautotrophic gill symbiont]